MKKTLKISSIIFFILLLLSIIETYIYSNIGSPDPNPAFRLTQNLDRLDNDLFEYIKNNHKFPENNQEIEKYCNKLEIETKCSDYFINLFDSKFTSERVNYDLRSRKLNIKRIYKKPNEEKIILNKRIIEYLDKKEEKSFSILYFFEENKDKLAWYLYIVDQNTNFYSLKVIDKNGNPIDNKYKIFSYKGYFYKKPQNDQEQIFSSRG